MVKPDPLLGWRVGKGRREKCEKSSVSVKRGKSEKEIGGKNIGI